MCMQCGKYGGISSKFTLQQGKVYYNAILQNRYLSFIILSKKKHLSNIISICAKKYIYTI